MLMFRRLVIQTQILDKQKSHSVIQAIVNVNDIDSVIIASCHGLKHHNTKTMCTTATVPADPEFVSESLVIPNKNAADLITFSEVIRKVKEKTGVIVKTFDEGDEVTKTGLKILFGGTRYEVQKAVSYMKFLQNQEPQKSNLLKDDGVTRQHFEKKEKPIWAYYRRNFKGQKPPMRTRKKCIRGRGESQVVSGNPCPICRLYLAAGYELDYKDIDLLSQFISPHTGEVFEATKTGVCRVQQENIIKAIQTAKDYGLLPYSIPGPRSIAKRLGQADIPRNVRLK